VGITLTADLQLVLQNRSHYITEASHIQFSNIGSWLETHRAELLRILRPGRDVLFGEWCRLQHSVFYDQLPDYFLAYDIYDRFPDIEKPVLKKKVEKKKRNHHRKRRVRRKTMMEKMTMFKEYFYLMKIFADAWRDLLFKLYPSSVKRNLKPRMNCLPC